MSDALSMLKNQVITALRGVFDPELPINIYDLGLVYDINVGEANDVNVRMTLTTPNCPVAETLPRDIQRKIESLPGVASAKVEVVFDPPWSVDHMSEVARFELECMGIDPTRLHGSRLTNLTIGRRPSDKRR